MDRKTKIIATIGPASADRDIIRRFKEERVDCIRINTAHGDIRQYDKMVSMIKRYSNIPLLIDIKGPDIRILTEEDIHIVKDEKRWFHCSQGNERPRFSFDFSDDVKKGDSIFFDNGQIMSKIMQKKGKSLLLRFYEDAVIGKNKGVNIPDKRIDIPSLSPKDKDSIRFAIKHKAAYVALSFTRDKKDVQALKKKLKDTGIGVISKIENKQGLENIDDIIEESDGVMIARGDLGAEIPEESIPLAQKDIIRRCNEKAKISIVATQMLETMVNKPIPTRAEVSDVANAILDGADCVMLSGETASGHYPVKSVQVMSKVAARVEAQTSNKINMEKQGTVSEEMSKSAYYILDRTSCKSLAVITKDGHSASLLARYRINENIIAITDDSMTAQRLSLLWGVRVIMKSIPKKKIIKTAAKELLIRGIVNKNESVLFLRATKESVPETLDVLEVHKISDIIKA